MPSRNSPPVPRTRPGSPNRLRPLAWLLGLALLSVACRQPEREPEFVARVGDHYLTRDELRSALAILPAVGDSTEARQQIVEQWVTNELLYRAANQEDLRRDPEVRRLLEQNERSVLIGAYLSRVFDEEPATPSRSDIEAYFQQHQEQLRLREPYVRIHYLTLGDPDSARVAFDTLSASVEHGTVDSTWSLMARRFSMDPEGSEELASSFLALSQVFPERPAIHDRMAGLRPGNVTPPFESGGRFHVIHLAERAEPGTLPRLEWVEEELKRKLDIEARKQLYARQVQRLRNEALASEDLEIRN